MTRRGGAAFLVGFVLVWTVLELTASPEPTPLRSGLAFAATLLAAVAAVVVLLRVPLREAPTALGLGVPALRAVVIAAVVGALCVGAYAMFPVVTGHALALREGWPLLAVGVWLVNGMAEELAWRGYVFGRLRRGRSFGRAALASMPLLALTHVPIVLDSGWVVGLAAMLVAAVTTWPLASLYEGGAATIWAPALLHAAIDSFRVVAIPPEVVVPFSLYVIAVALTVPLLVFPLGRALRTVRAHGPGERHPAA